MSRKQCKEFTKSGLRCKIFTKNDTCHIHKKVYLSTDPGLFNNPNMTEEDFLNVKLIPKKHKSCDTFGQKIQSQRSAPDQKIQSQRSQKIPKNKPADAKISSRRKTLEPPTLCEREGNLSRLSLGSKTLSPKTLSSTDELNCCVCYESASLDDKLKCSHVVCRSCVSNMRDTRCPTCRRVMSSKNISFWDKLLMKERKREDEIERQELLLQEFLLNHQYV